MALHRQLPGKPLVVSGFSGRLDPRGWNEAEITARLFAQQGIDPARVRFEAQSRNTAENARLTAALVGQGDEIGRAAGKGTSVAVRVDLGGRRIIEKKKNRIPNTDAN